MFKNDVLRPFGAPRNIHWGRKTVALAFATLLTGGATLLGATAPASADIPATPKAAVFEAPACAGTTDFDPAQSGATVNNLQSVFGKRLDAFNEGRVIPLYDSYGGTNASEPDNDGFIQYAYPPLCGTRYVASADDGSASNGAVSEWMYCTDRSFHACGGVGTDGGILDDDNLPVDPMQELPVNPKLTADQERLISYLVQQGHSYAGVGDQSWGGATEARSDAGTNERTALQTLVWCISDAPKPAEQAAVPQNGFTQTCNAVMPQAEQARLLALIPAVAEVHLDFSQAQTTFTVGEVARVSLTTNVYNQPIEFASNTAGSIVACQGSNVQVTGTTITVPGTDSAVDTTVELCYTATEPGSVELSVEAQPASTSHVSWNQSSNAGATIPCQVFAAYNEARFESVSDRAAATFIAAVIPTTTPATPALETPAVTTPATTPAGSNATTPATASGAMLASTGVETNVGLWVAAAALLGGLMLLLVRRRSEA
ncbi:LPXTG cell wall anchor domain-containing protein [Lysinibacter cavernae]|uniref:LPXTG-motif cell wall-anchored protein n=1 Tax=Lysinibacter cavernae TaxID=1640652 RepID=A0A7X5R0W8_9MICO|nr:LPXTG cell wall anchor domain-containing protein [Lysinibacter cavernae]NIH53548.1 LPXTG-motif cell wall-anchored protein [Lysinibacter cavernae]